MQSINRFKYIYSKQNLHQWGLEVLSVGFSSVPTYSPYPTTEHPKGYLVNWHQKRRLPNYQIIYITKGSGRIKFENSEAHHLKEGHSFLILPNQYHQYEPNQDTGWNEYWIEFNGPMTNSFLGNLFSSHQVQNTRIDEVIITLFQQSIQWIENEPPGFEQLLSANCLQILAHLNSLFLNQKHQSSPHDRKINLAKQTILDQFNQQIDMQLLAKSLDLSYTWFRKCFKSRFGISPHQYQLQIKILKARDLLIRSNKTIEQISNELGFESAYYFSRLFKKKIGIAPIEFRKQHLSS